jgi:oligoendopeptidase F
MIKKNKIITSCTICTEDQTKRKKSFQKMSKSCQKVAKKLSKSCKKVVKKRTKLKIG